MSLAVISENKSMMLSNSSNSRVKWVDEVKVIACILVVLGHFLQSMTKAGILPANDLYQWFNQTIYYFHVWLFFICSGYLYQRYSKVDSLSSWWRNIRKKALALGVPYLTFSLVTWLFKTLLSSDVNDQVGGLAETLFLQPMSPYWYLYCLFFIFLVMPTFRSTTGMAAGIVLAILLKGLSMSGIEIRIYAIASACSNLVLFVLGMTIARLQMQLDNKRMIGVLCGGIFLVLSVVFYRQGIDNEPLRFMMTILACTSVVTLTAANEDRIDRSRVLRLLTRYTLPIYLMHTLIAAPVRIVLLKVGIMNAVVHVVLGLLASIAGPMLAAVIMRRLKYPEFLLYPTRFVRL